MKHIPCRSSYNTSKNGYANLKDTLSTATSHHFSTNQTAAQATQDHLHYINSDKRKGADIYLHKNEYFPGYTLHKPVPSLPHYANIDRSAESSVATSKRHFCSQGIPSIDRWMDSKNYLAIVKYVKDVVIDVLKKKLKG